MMSDWVVEPISKKEADRFVVAKHYSRRASVYWAAYALLIDGFVEGVVVYGQPSPQSSKHAFVDRDFRLYELSRLVIQTELPNAASFLVGQSLRLLPKPNACISFADSSWGHAGIVYQATNWLYTGGTKSHDSLYLIDGKSVHPMTLRDQGIKDPKRWAKENGVKTVPPEVKHRYFYINARSKREKREMLGKLKYPVLSEYPKLPRSRYDAGDRIVLTKDPLFA